MAANPVKEVLILRPCRYPGYADYSCSG